MEELKELVHILSKNKVKQIEIVGAPGGHSSNLDKLYDGLASGKFENEAEAKTFFFGDSPRKSFYFSRLKGQLRSRLYNTLFFIDVNQPGFDDIQKAYYTCYKDFATIKILLGRNARRPAISLAEKTLRRALKYEFADISLDIARLLRNHYGTMEGQEKKYVEYNRIVKELFDVLAAELKAEEYFNNLIINFVYSKSSRTDIRQEAAQYADELADLISRYSSYRLNFYAYRVFVLRFQIENDYIKTLEECKRAIQYFEADKTRNSAPVLFTFLFYSLSCCIQLKRYQEGEAIADRCLSLLSQGSTNWFVTLESYAMLALHTRNYQKAYEILRVALDHPGFKNLYPGQKEQWKVIEAYVQYFVVVGEIDPDSSGEGQTLKKFKMGKFLNEVPKFSKDKRGTNISIVILQILFLLQKRQYFAVIDRMEALNMYSYRYLKKDETYRSNCFIKMLVQVPKANFHPVAAQRKATPFMKKLEQVPLEIARQGSEIEIVPYEALWEFALKSLQQPYPLQKRGPLQ